MLLIGLLGLLQNGKGQVLFGLPVVIECALRELREETGYTGTPVWHSPSLTLNAAILRYQATVVGVRIADDSKPEGIELDPEEDIESRTP